MPESHNTRRVWTPEEQKSINRTVRNLAAGMAAAMFIAPRSALTTPTDDEAVAAEKPG